MNRSARKQHHELARKKHRHDAEAHARELAKKPPSRTAAWILGVGVAIVVAAIVATALF